MKKMFLVLLVCGLVFVSVVFSNSNWQVLSESEVGEFISQLDEEDELAYFQEEGLKSVKILFGFPSRENPTIIWIVRMTKEIKGEETFVRRNFIGFGRFYLDDDQQPESEEKGDAVAEGNGASLISM